MFILSITLSREWAPLVTHAIFLYSSIASLDSVAKVLSTITFFAELKADSFSLILFKLYS